MSYHIDKLRSIHPIEFSKFGFKMVILMFNGINILIFSQKLPFGANEQSRFFPNSFEWMEKLPALGAMRNFVRGIFYWVLEI